MTKYRRELYKSGRDSKWYWRVRARNGKIVADGGEGYSRRIDADRQFRKLFSLDLIGEAMALLVRGHISMGLAKIEDAYCRIDVPPTKADSCRYPDAVTELETLRKERAEFRTAQEKLAAFVSKHSDELQGRITDLRTRLEVAEKERGELVEAMTPLLRGYTHHLLSRIAASKGAE